MNAQTTAVALPAGTDELLTMGSATLYEASGKDCFLDPAFRPAWSGAQIVGRALPVEAGLGDNLALHWGIATAQPGDVLMVNAGGGAYGYFGEVMAVASQAQGLAGLVINGGVRDTAQLQDIGFPAFSTVISIQGTIKEWPGRLSGPISMRGRVVNRGDLVVADADGIAVIPQHLEAEVIASARQRVSTENTYMAQLREGAMTLDLYSFRDLGDPV